MEQRSRPIICKIECFQNDLRHFTNRLNRTHTPDFRLLPYQGYDQVVWIATVRIVTLHDRVDWLLFLT